MTGRTWQSLLPADTLSAPPGATLAAGGRTWLTTTWASGLGEDRAPSPPTAQTAYQIEVDGPGRTRARQTSLGRWVDLHVLDGLDKDTVRALETEALVAGLVAHPGLPPVHDGGDGYLVFGRVRGVALDALLATGEHQLPQLVAHLERVAEALAAAHAQGVVHRSLHPAAIVVGPGGEVVVGGWGLAVAVAEPALGHGIPDLGQDDADLWGGCPARMAPECAALERARIGPPHRCPWPRLPALRDPHR